MNLTPAILIFDVGKTNKKCFVFDEAYRIVFEQSATLPETKDEDGDPCEDVAALTEWVLYMLQEVLERDDVEIQAINCTAYGASFVYLNEAGKVVAPLYNYLKPYPADLQAAFYRQYGGEAAFARRTASPVLGSLNSGMQVYRLKYEQSGLFARIRYALHLPQYLASLFSGRFYSEATSIGCHTNLWDFEQNKYDGWVEKEGLVEIFPPFCPAGEPAQTTVSGQKMTVGTGLHDSSAALIPYLAAGREPFALISTGTWCITLNPFNDSPLTDTELRQDCLCYRSYEGKPVKAARFFGGHEHDLATRRLAEQFQQAPDFYKNLPSRPATTQIETAYLHFMNDFVARQAASTRLVLSPGIKRLFVDGGFSNNSVYLRLLAAEFPGMELYTTSIPQAAALGAALALHPHWNTRPLPDDLLECQRIIP